MIKPRKTIAHLFFFSIQFLLVFSSFQSNLKGQDFEFDLEVIDLNKTPGYGKCPDAVKAIGDKIYMVFESNGKVEMMVYDHKILTTLFDGGENIRFYSNFRNGFFFSFGVPATGLALYYMDASSDEMTQIIDDNFRDINILENQAIFSAWKGDIYTTDGTQQGTKLLKDFEYHLFDTYGNSLLTSVQKKQLFVIAGNVWSTDGTVNGTVELLKQEPMDLDPISSYRKYFEFHQDLAFFVLRYTYPEETRGLWVTDGTPEGTKRLTGEGTDFPAQITFVTSTKEGLLFAANSEEFGNEFWITDGTANGTSFLKDIAQGTDSGVNLGYSNGNMHSFKDFVLFRYGTEVWQCNGTTEGTKRILDFANFANYNENWSITSSVVNTEGLLFFTTNQQNGSVTIWTYSDNGDAPRELTIVTQQDRFPWIKNYVDGHKVYLHFYKNDDQIWVTDGTTEGTLKVDSNSSVNILTVHNDILYYKSTFDYRDSLLVSDGTLAGTGVLKTNQEGVGFTKPELFFESNETCYFFARDTELGWTLMTSEGKINSTKTLLDIFPFTLGADYRDLRQAGGKLYFIKDYKLWVSDGTEEGSLNLNVNMSNLSYLGEIDDKMLFLYDRREIWVTDGTLLGTKQLLYNPNFIPNQFRGFTQFQNKIWFFFDDELNGLELWYTDGTPEGTFMAFESLPNEETIFKSPSELVNNSQTIFFVNRDENNINNLWISDGTLAGTSILKATNSTNFGAAPSELIIYNNQLLFNADNSFWISDGTTLGTRIIKEEFSFRPELTTSAIEGDYIFNGNQGLWLTDGTTEGTRLIINLDARKITQFNNSVVFTTPYSNNLDQPWISDGTEEGTFILKQLNATYTAFVDDYTQVGNFIFFSADEERRHNTIWYSDGTKEGTLQTPYSYQEMNYPEFLTLYNNKLYFLSRGRIFGEELYYLDFGFIRDNCQKEVITNTNRQLNIPDSLIASETIFSTDIIGGSADISYIAGNTITLSNGFHAKAGAMFYANIKGFPCLATTNLEQIKPKEIFKKVHLNEKQFTKAPDFEIIPNPIIHQATINFSVPQPANVSFDLFNLSGTKLKTILSPTNYEQGNYQIKYIPSGLEAGLYFLCFRNNNEMKVKKIVINNQ